MSEGDPVGSRSPLLWSDALPLAALVAAIAVFTYGWTDYGWQLYLSLHLPVFDFGINYQLIWAAAHGTELDFFGIGIGSLLIYAFVPVFWLIPSESGFFLFLIAFQAAWLAAGSIPLFLVARDRLRNRWAALALALSYLAFPALAGPVWFPFHFEALFPTLFLFGYWLYRRGSTLGSASFWTASLFAQVGGVIVMGFFAVGILLEPRLPGWFATIRRHVSRNSPETAPAGIPGPEGESLGSRRFAVGVYLLIASVSLFLILATVYGWFWFLHYVTKSGPSAVSLTQPLYSAPSLTNIPVQAWTMLLLFGPLLALPLFGREERWAMIPYLTLLLFTSQHGFWFPFRNQYSALLIGPLFASAVRGLERIEGWWPPTATASGLPHALRRARRRLRPRNLAGVASATILVAVLATGAFIAPWGPFNPTLRENGFLSTGFYNDSLAYGTNLTLDAQLRALANSIPPGGVVLTQTQVVEPLNREYYLIPSRFAPNVPLQYVLADPYSPSFYGHNLDGPYNTTMEQWANYYLQQGWSVRGEVDGALLLAAAFSGPPTLYQPVDQWFSAASFPCCAGPGLPWNGSTHGPWTYGPSTPYDGSYNVFSPGVFNVTLTFRVDHPKATDHLSCVITGDKGQTELWSSTISGAGWTAVNGTVQVTLPLDVPTYALSPRVSMHVAQWTGPLQLVSLHLLEVAPPPSLSTG
ncbi:MAG: DUF2079 domain-containing protein [Thermoplasmata archaeon]|nr:DUF2079 domain-containing protein [Thermoplasmata archaeon]